MATSSFFTENKGDGFLSDIANSAVKADVECDNWEMLDGKWSWRNILYILTSVLGI